MVEQGNPSEKNGKSNQVKWRVPQEKHGLSGATWTMRWPKLSFALKSHQCPSPGSKMDFITAIIENTLTNPLNQMIATMFCLWVPMTSE